MVKPKRPALLDSIDMATESAATPAQVVEIKKPNASTTTVKQATVKSSLYLPPKAHRLLKEIAFAQDCKVHDLVIEGIDRVLNSHGYGTVAEVAKK